MKSKSFMLMILSMGFGLIAAIGISQVMGNRNGPATDVAQTGPVVVAAEHLANYAILDETKVTVENWPIGIIPENAVTNLEQLKEMAMVAPLSKGLPIMLTSIKNKREIQNIHIPEGQKVVAIKVAEDDTIAGLLKPGDKVDLIGLFKTRRRDGTSQSIPKTFLKGIRVFSINAQMRAAEGNRTETSTRGSAIIGVLVSERQAEAVFYVQKTGTLKVVMRGDHIESGDENNDEELWKALTLTEEKEIADDNQEDEPVIRTVGNSTTMVVWEGSEPNSFTFENGVLPKSSNSTSSQPRTRQQRNESSEEVNEGVQEGPPGYDESDRGLEEDQYRGE